MSGRDGIDGRRARVFLLVATIGLCLIGATVAWASQTLTFSVRLTPDKLDAPTNLSAETTIASAEGTPSPVSNVVAYLPAGLKVHVQGIATCEKAKLETEGADGCPADSRVGFGGGEGVVQLGGELVKEHYTLDFFLAPSEAGHLAVLIYVDAVSPAPVELVLVGKEIAAPKPYGFAVSVQVPPVSTVPGAAYASVETNYVSIGATNVEYYETVHGKRKLVHIKGLTAPKTCSGHGFPFALTMSFADGTTSTASSTDPCPRG